MNFTEFKGIERSDAFFWYLAVPIGVTTMLALLNGPLIRQVIKLFRRRQISKVRRLRERQERKERPRLRLNATRRLTFSPRKAKDKSSTKQANGDMTIPEEPPMPSGSETIARDMAFNDGSERITIEP
ncbi:hypothetical protein TWF706_000812 [Orbilia oligospora]|nr:hypothetical protein TWF706_000812 [Orbilia oligospora]